MRILQAFITDDNGGLTKYIIQNYINIRRYEIQFDFLTYQQEKLSFEDLVNEKGANIFHIKSVMNIIYFCYELKKILKNHRYDVVHFNMSYVNFVPILIIKIMLPSETKIIFHGHSMGIDNENVFIKVIKTCIHKIGRHVIPILCDGFLCCSNDAGKWMFTEKTRKRNVYKIAHNAIDITPFLFQKTVRTSIREKLKIRDDDIVIGNIGRFTYQKNHEFLIDVFDKCLLMNPRYKLMLIGDGPNKEMIEKKVSALGIEDRVMFLGVRKDVHKLLQAMDIFCLPSRFEGLGIVGIEAQASGLTCLVSDVVPKDLGVTDKCKFLSLNSDLWLSEILKYDVCNPLDRMNTLYPIKNAGYEINDEIKEMVRYYNSLVKM